MKYISLRKEIAAKIAEQGMEFSGRLSGYLARERGDIFNYDTGNETVPVDSGVKVALVRDNDELIVFSFKTKDPEHYTNNRGEFPVVLALPLSGKEVTLVSSNIVYFDFECTNEMWRKIIEQYRKNVEKRLEIDLGISDYSLLTDEPVFSFPNNDPIRYYNTDSLTLFYELIIPKERRAFFRDLYKRREELFDRELKRRRAIEYINIANMDLTGSIAMEIETYIKDQEGNE